MKWQHLEQQVRDIASLIWNATPAAEVVNGVKCDCILKLAPDYWVAIEISKEISLVKLRTDLAKFASIRPYLTSQGIYAKCLFVTEGEPPPSVVVTGKGASVEVLSAKALSERFFNYSNYTFVRQERAFGSAVD
ncbi:MAG: hypothetical protein QOF78_2919, partial [Phycisphaerales bacterium]|nr:hypothetical protein [Phycisphaerales bacterium]